MKNNKETELIKGSEIIPRDVEWLWYPYIPYGKITIIQGDPGEGKRRRQVTAVVGTKFVKKAVDGVSKVIKK